MKQAAIFALILLPSALFSWWNRDMPQLGVHHDDSIYWVGAKSLASGQGYRILSFPGEPFQTKYPPLFPALLSLVWRFDADFPHNLRWAALLVWLLLPLYLMLAKRVATDFGCSSWWSWGITAAIGWNVVTVLLSLSLMSELAFSIALLAVLTAAERRTIPSLAVGLMAGAAFLIRSLALPLAITVPFCFWIGGRRKDAILFLCGMLPAIAGWLAWVHFHHVSATDAETLYYTSYLGFHLKYIGFADLPTMVWTNFGEYFSAVGRLLIFNIDQGFWSMQLARITSFAALMGTYRMVKRTGRFQYAAYAVGASVLLLLWNYAPSPRFMYALYPLLLVGWTTEMIHLFGMLAQAFQKPKKDDKVAAVFVGAVACVYVGIFAWFTGIGLMELMPQLMQTRAALTEHDRVAYDWIRNNTDSNARFFAYDDVMLYLYTGRQALSRQIPPNLLFRDDKNGIERHVQQTPDVMKEKSLGYLLLTDTDYSRDANGDQRRMLQKIVSEDPSFQIVFRNPHSTIYRYFPRPPDEPRDPPVSPVRPAGAAAAAAFEGAAMEGELD